MKRALLVLALIQMTPLGAHATGPFGFNYGETRESILARVGTGHIVKHLAGANSRLDEVYLDTAPLPNPGFETYDLIFGPNKGFLKLIVIGKTIQTSGSGEQLRKMFHETGDALAALYGPARTLDHIDQGSRWKDEAEWMDSLLHGDRKLGSMFEHGKARSEHILGVVLEVEALKPEAGYLRLTYEFKGWDAYSDSLKSRDDSVF